MANLKLMPQYEDEDIASQIATAQALRNRGLSAPEGQMVGGFYVPTNPLATFGRVFGGGVLENMARGQQGELQEARRRQDEEFLARMPGATVERTRELAGPATEEGIGPGSITETVAKDPRQLEQEMYQYGVSAPNTQLGQQMRQHALQRAMASPERMAAQAEKVAAAAAAAEEKKQTALTLAREKAEAEAKRDRERAEDKKENLRLAASLRPAKEPKLQIIDTVDEQGNPVKKIVEMAPGVTLPSVPGGKVKEPTESERSSAGYLGRMQTAEQKMGTIGAAKGRENILQKAIGATVPAVRPFAETTEQQLFRQAAEDWVRAKLRKESGATITPAEMAEEIRTYFPQPGDDARMVEQKRQSRMQAQEQLKSSAGRAKPTYADRGGEAAAGADAEALQWANANPNDPRAAKIKARLGVK